MLKSHKKFGLQSLSFLFFTRLKKNMQRLEEKESFKITKICILF